MRDHDLVRRIVYEMGRPLTRIPVTVKCRIGVDGDDDYDRLCNFVTSVKSAGANHVIVHARTCMLNGLNPSQNRNIPPLQPHIVHQLVRDFPDMTFCLNGGITSFDQADTHMVNPYPYTPPSGALFDLPPVPSVMLGRLAWHDPLAFHSVDTRYFHAKSPNLTRRQIIDGYLDYAAQFDVYQPGQAEGPDVVPMYMLIRPLHYLFAGCKGAKQFRIECCRLYEAKGKGGGVCLADLVAEAVETGVDAALLDEAITRD